MTVNVIKWKSAVPVSITHVVWKHQGTLANIKSMHIRRDGSL